MPEIEKLLEKWQEKLLDLKINQANETDKINMVEQFIKDLERVLS